jgi:hypothetical protein
MLQFIHMKALHEILEKNATVVANLLKKMKEHQHFSKIFRGMIDKNFAQNCHFANLEKSVLTVTVPNTSWATKLRYAIPDIIKILQTQPEFKKVSKIRYHIENNNKEDILKIKKKPLEISEKNKILWQETLAKLRKQS